MEDRLKEIETAYKEKILSQRAYNLEKELLPIVKEMEKTGIKLDVNFLESISKKINIRVKELEEGIYKLARIQFNINSSQQLSEVLFEKLKISTDDLRKTPKGVVSTAATELQKIRGKHEIIDFILEYRELMKLKTTYVDSLPKLVDENNRIHTTYHLLGTTTGRMSSSDPNLQNIPIRGEWGQRIREAFVAEKGHKLLSADYSQVELRVAACLAQDEKMLKAFREDKDVHKATAAEINNIPLSEVTPGMRFQAKALNFGILYGMSISGFAKAAGVSWEEASKFVKEYTHDFVGIAQYIEQIKEQAREKGYVETILGRRRYLPQINSPSFRTRQAAERMAINMPIQGTAADIIKVAMLRLNRKLKEEKSEARMLLQVHDELVLEVKEDFLKETVELVREGMENVLKESIFEENKHMFEIPLKIDIKTGHNWGICEDYLN